MPRRDGRGPRGLGPMTGRGFGPCPGSRAFRCGVGIVGMGLGLGLACREVLRSRDRKKARFIQK